MTIKQKKLADEYIKTGNATQSAINAGYSEKTARKIGSDSQLYKQAGNAIVVDVLAAIFMQLFKN